MFYWSPFGANVQGRKMAGTTECVSVSKAVLADETIDLGGMESIMLCRFGYAARMINFDHVFIHSS